MPSPKIAIRALNERLVALEQRNEELEQRVVELEEAATQSPAPLKKAVPSKSQK